MRRLTRVLLLLTTACAILGCPTDGDPVFIVTASPTQDATGVSVNTVLTLLFDRAIDPDSLDYGMEPAVAIAASWSADERTLTLSPVQTLANGVSYTLTVYAVEAHDGGGLEEDFVLRFTTAGASEGEGEGEGEGEIDYRQAMRDFVRGISAYAKARVTGFAIIPQNGEPLLTPNGEPDGPLHAEYLATIDGQGREDVFYGYTADNVATPAAERDRILGYLDAAAGGGITVMVTDYCSTPSFVDNSYAQNAARGYISFAADRRDLDRVPVYPAQPYNVNADDIASLAAARNFLYWIQPDEDDRVGFLAALDDTDYDVLLIDAFVGDTMLTPAEIAPLKTKKNDGARLIVAYMSIGEAEDYRYYWQAGWGPGNPDWIVEENPDWPGNYKVRYWDPAWQAIIFGSPDAYLDRILAAGFHGVYLDIIDGFEFFEDMAR